MEASGLRSVGRTMKLKYYWLGLAFIIITHVPHASMSCFSQEKRCCPNHHNATYWDTKPTWDPDFKKWECENGKEMNVYYCHGTPGTYCKTLKKCFAGKKLSDYDYVSFPCKISNSEQHSCSNQTERYKVCRGTLTSLAACRK